ncbi:MAG: putative membrane protein [Colwellia polaris]|jgi:uncharacterized membrane protein
MLGWIKSFLYKYYWLPIIDESVYYNPVNTITYALLFGVIAVYFLPWFIDRLNLKFDKELTVALTPYIFLSGAVRSLKDGAYLDTILLETPIIYIVMIGFTLTTLFISRKIEERIKYSYSNITALTGISSLIVILSLFDYTLLEGLSWFLITASMSLAAIYGILRLLGADITSITSVGPIFAHFWDASSTYVVLSYGGVEKHVLADLFIELLGPKGIFLMKGLVIFPAVLYINKEFEEEERNYYLFIIAMLGFALGTRNILSLITG